MVACMSVSMCIESTRSTIEIHSANETKRKNSGYNEPIASKRTLQINPLQPERR
ncbi:hypothetical protein RDWZM_002894, partial [Blomia tropicalis]